MSGPLSRTADPLPAGGWLDSKINCTVEQEESRYLGYSGPPEPQTASLSCSISSLEGRKDRKGKEKNKKK